MSRYINIIIFSFLIVMVSSVASADHSHGYKKANDAFNAGDYQTAIHLWSEEAANGEITAQEMLGAIYASGKGVKLNYTEAANWYQMAAKKGSASSQYNLGYMYYEGKGVDKSLTHAYAWLLIAAANGNTGAKVRKQVIFNEMSPEQVEDAKQLIFDFLNIISE